jgi:hypothetical protein
LKECQYLPEEINSTRNTFSIRKEIENENLQEVTNYLKELLRIVLTRNKCPKPYPVQVYAILRLCYEIQYCNDKAKYNPGSRELFRSIAEIKTGEGKSLVIALTSITIPLLPYFLSFAAGAMIYVVIEELIPSANIGKHSNIATMGFAIGFTLMMILDVVLG